MITWFITLFAYGQALLSGNITPVGNVPNNYIKSIEIARDGMVKKDGKEQCIGVGSTWSWSMYAMAISCSNWSAWLITDTKTYRWVRVWRYKFY